MVFRRVGFFLVFATALLVFSTPARLPASTGAPARTAPGALPQTPSALAQPARPGVPAMSARLYIAFAERGLPALTTGGLPQTNGRGVAEWAAEAGWGAAPVNVARRTSLRPAPPIGQPLQWGEHAARTNPSASKPAAMPAQPRVKAGALLLAVAMIVAIMAVARRAPQAIEAEEPTVAGARAQMAPSRGGPCLRTEKPNEGLRRFPVDLGILSVAPRDQAAIWERVRLVPT